MKKGVLVILILLVSSTIVYAFGTLGPQGSNQSTSSDVVEVTGSATIDPGKIRQGNTIAMLILAIMGIGLYGVLRYCKNNV